MREAGDAKIRLNLIGAIYNTASALWILESIIMWPGTDKLFVLGSVPSCRRHCRFLWWMDAGAVQSVLDEHTQLSFYEGNTLFRSVMRSEKSWRSHVQG